ncbi:MAG TPA: dienelactone hydrolase family protein [Candidatus Omnitrophota bacterium]|nr:dienelactone hydrolase family protein [Candidatus Omnitrophota bacterium]
MLDSVILETSKTSDAAVIWLHGLGADGHDFESIVPELRLPTDLKIRFIFPHAPSMPVTVNGGYVMPAWYDIAGQNILSGEDEAGMKRSQKQIVELIEAEKKKGISDDRIILAGFSQGGAMTLFTGLRYPQKLAGLMVLSAYLPLAEKTTAEMNEANSKTPVFMAHGKQDGVVPYEGARISKEFLLKRGCPVEWHEYNMAHSIHPQEIRDISAWIQAVLR